MKRLATVAALLPGAAPAAALAAPFHPPIPQSQTPQAYAAFAVAAVVLVAALGMVQWLVFRR